MHNKIILVNIITSIGLRPRHFIKISEVVGFEVRNDDATHFRQLLRLNVSAALNTNYVYIEI